MVIIRMLENRSNKIKMTLRQEIAFSMLEMIGSLVDVFKLTITPGGWKMSAVDPANVAMISIDLPEDNFTTYEVQDTREVALHVMEVRKFVECDPDSKTVMTFDTNENTLRLEQGMFYRKLDVIASSEVRKTPKIPDINLGLDYSIKIHTWKLKSILTEAERIDDFIKLGFRLVDGEMTFTAQIEDTWGAVVRAHDWIPLCNNPHSETGSLFSIDYLHDIVPKIPSDKLWIHLGKDSPCKISFTLGETGKVEYLQAPRIETE